MSLRICGVCMISCGGGRKQRGVSIEDRGGDTVQYVRTYSHSH